MCGCCESTNDKKSKKKSKDDSDLKKSRKNSKGESDLKKSRKNSKGQSDLKKSKITEADSDIKKSKTIKKETKEKKEKKGFMDSIFGSKSDNKKKQKDSKLETVKSIGKVAIKNKDTILKFAKTLF